MTRPDAVTADGLHFGSSPTDPNGVADCAVCAGAVVVDGQLCPSCAARQQLRTAWFGRRASVDEHGRIVWTRPNS